MVALILVIVVGLATFRATRVITTDAFPPARIVRDTVRTRFGDDSWQAYLAECVWCASVYVSFLFVFGYDWCDVLPGVERTHVPMPFFVFLACSGIAGLIAARLDGD